MLPFVTPNASTPFLNADGTVSPQWYLFLSSIMQSIGGPPVIPGGVVNSFVAASLLNSWVNYGTPYNVVGYARDTLGYVYLRGVVAAGTMGSPIFTLPTGFRPANEELLTASSRDDFGRIDVLPTGDVVPKYGTNVYISLDGLRFKSA